MIAESGAWIKRAEEILVRGAGTTFQSASESFHFATSMLSALYGPESPQMQSLRSSAAKIHDSLHLSQLSRGAIKNAKAELEAGLIGSVRVYVAGEVLAELVRLGKEILEERTEAAKNVSAVLISAAFEGVLRKLGEQAGIAGRPKLEEVVSVLKTADVLKGGQPHTASGYLKLRNDSLHADWQKVDRSQVEGCLLFVESLLQQHFS